MDGAWEREDSQVFNKAIMDAFGVGDSFDLRWTHEFIASGLEVLRATRPDFRLVGMRTLEGKSDQEVAIAVQPEPGHVRTHHYCVLERLHEFVRYTIGQRQDAKNDAQK